MTPIVKLLLCSSGRNYLQTDIMTPYSLTLKLIRKDFPKNRDSCVTKHSFLSIAKLNSPKNYILKTE